MMSNIPYSCRVLALVVLATALVVHDRRKGRSARLWEYGCLFLLGIVGAAFGAANDAITVRISPDYFALGKGLAAEPSLAFNAIRLGSQAGFSAAVIACAIWLFALRHAPAQPRCRLIATAAWLPFAAAVVLSIAFPVALERVDPLRFSQRLAGIISSGQIRSFITVWWAHTGAYVGLCVGLAAGIMLTRQQTRIGQNKAIQVIRPAHEKT